MIRLVSFLETRSIVELISWSRQRVLPCPCHKIRPGDRALRVNEAQDKPRGGGGGRW